jgi:type I restriction enzyme M protein
MAINNLVKRIQNIMRQDAGINGDAQRIEEMVWMFFLKVYDAQEENWECMGDNYHSIIPEKLRWRNWAVDNADGKALTGDELLDFVNNELFPQLKDLNIGENTPRGKTIVKEVFQELNQYMKNGILLRQVINIVDEVDFSDAQDRHLFGDL